MTNIIINIYFCIDFINLLSIRHFSYGDNATYFI